MRMQMPPQPTTQAAKLWARKFSLFGKKAINIIYSTVSNPNGQGGGLESRDEHPLQKKELFMEAAEETASKAA